MKDKTIKLLNEYQTAGCRMLPQPAKEMLYMLSPRLRAYALRKEGQC